MNKHLTEQAKQYIAENYQKQGGKHCAEKLGIPYSCINNYARRKDFKVRKNMRYYKNNIDINKWRKMEDPIICYLLGLIFADGWTDKKRVNIQILKSDFDEILPKIKNTYNKATIYNRKRKHWKETTCFTLSSVLLSNMVNELGFKGNDFNCIEHIPKYNLHIFFRGYFDGDGHIKLSDTKASGSKLQFASTYDFNWEKLENIINPLYLKLKRKPRKMGCTIKRYVNLKNHKSSSLILTNKEVILKFLNWIYFDWDQNGVGLSRKYGHFLKSKNVISSYSSPTRD